MHKSFYASGFLYHSPSQQILLQQTIHKNLLNFSLFKGKSRNSADPKVVFQRCVEKTLGISITPSSVHTVYDYIHDTDGVQFIFYIEVKKNIPGTGWILLSKLSKYSMDEQTRHDLIIGERVIRSIKRITSSSTTCGNSS